MDTLKVEWEQTNWTSLNEYYDTIFYAFTRGTTLLYIGIAYHQNANNEIRSTLNRLNISTTGLTIWLGYVNYDRSTYARITEQIVKDAECLMIYANQPSYNTQCMSSYTGRNNLKVRTSGCSLIRNCVRCEYNTVYRSC